MRYDYRENADAANQVVGEIEAQGCKAIAATFFFWNGKGPSNKQKREIKKWYWATTVGSRYSGRDFYRCLPDDLRFFKRLCPNGRAQFRYTPQVDEADVRKSQYAARTGITSAFYTMLMKRGPVSLLDDGLNEIPPERYSTNANRKDRHHIFPRKVLFRANFSPKLYNSICNICLLTAEENQSIGSRKPSSYLVDAWERPFFKRKMARHLIPASDDNGVWMKNVRSGYTTFLRERTAMIVRALEKEAGLRLFIRQK